MTKRRGAMMATAAAVAMFTVGAALAADSIGTPGKIYGLEHNDDSSDEAGLRDGALFIDEGDVVREYLWGGSLCPGRDLDIDQQRMLLDALRSKIILLPYYKLGNGNSRCLTSFGFTGKKGAIADITK